jgi:hypothetical protein
MANEARHISVSIERDYASAYEFLSIPENFPKWASGLCGSLRREDDQWKADTPRGSMTLRFSDRNPYGVLDHWVVPQAGSEIYVPMRVVRNGNGCELSLTLLRHKGMSDEQFEEDTQWVQRDLVSVKQLLESH